MPVTLEQSDAACIVRLDGAINIASAAELKTVLLQALASGVEVRVEVERAVELDVTALQLLWAAGREASATGTPFTLIGQVPEEISVAITEAGFQKFPVDGEPGTNHPAQVE